jgi:hypothetical protein
LKPAWLVPAALPQNQLPGEAASATAGIRDGEQVPHDLLAQVRLCEALALLARGDADHASEQLAAILGPPPGMRLATFTSRLS